MKTILAFGDSITWGSCPFDTGRHPKADRWPDAMAAGLDGVDVISEGLRGRTTAYPRPGVSDLRGDAILPTVLHTHTPIDLVMIMLGTNDMAIKARRPDIYWGLRRLVEIVQRHPYDPYDAPQIMLISPPGVTAGKFIGVDDAMVAECLTIHEIVQQVATEYGTAFFDAATVAKAEAGDGLHLEASVSRGLGVALQDPVAKLLGLERR